MEEMKNTTRTVQEEMSRERKFWKQNQLWTGLLAVVALFMMLGQSGQSVAPGATELMLTLHDGSSIAVDYDSITSVELLENADYGSSVTGTDTRTGKSGTWENAAWGSYTLCAYSSCSMTVCITTEDHCYVVNLPSEEETRQLYQLIADKLPATR